MKSKLDNASFLHYLGTFFQIKLDIYWVSSKTNTGVLLCFFTEFVICMLIFCRYIYTRNKDTV